MQAATAVARLCRCTGSPEPSLLAEEFITKFSCAGTNITTFKSDHMITIALPLIFGTCDYVRPQLTGSVTETSLNIGCSDLLSISTISSNKNSVDPTVYKGRMTCPWLLTYTKAGLLTR